MSRLQNKVAVITGGTSGIGLAAVKPAGEPLSRQAKAAVPIS